MARTIPVIEGQFGTSQYYMTTMKASEVVQSLIIPKDLKGWEDPSIEERFQRELNFNRVKNQIAPYLAENKNRFFSSLVVAIYGGDDPIFTPLADKTKVDPAYSEAANRLGFLTLQSNNLVPLDGQHRLAALKFAITGKDEKGKDIPDHKFTANPDLSDEDISIILIRYNKKNSRRIFNNLNRYAKPTSKADNLITTEEDIFAIIAREDIAGLIKGTRIINIRNNQLGDNQHYFTTLATLYDCVTEICVKEFNIKGKPDITNLPDKQTVNLYKEKCIDIFSLLFKEVETFKIATSDPSETGDQQRIDMRKTEGSLLMKPIGQKCLTIAFQQTISSETSSGSYLDPKIVCQRINEIDWSKDQDMWRFVLMEADGATIKYGKAVENFATQYISYLIGKDTKYWTDSTNKNELLDAYQNNFPPKDRSDLKLPKQINL